jgi:hypothetical protein
MHQTFERTATTNGLRHNTGNTFEGDVHPFCHGVVKARHQHELRRQVGVALVHFLQQHRDLVGEEHLVAGAELTATVPVVVRIPIRKGERGVSRRQNGVLQIDEGTGEDHHVRRLLLDDGHEIQKRLVLEVVDGGEGPGRRHNAEGLRILARFVVMVPPQVRQRRRGRVEGGPLADLVRGELASGGIHPLNRHDLSRKQRVRDLVGFQVRQVDLDALPAARVARPLQKNRRFVDPTFVGLQSEKK